MQFSHLFTGLALAMAATALPAGENVDMLAPRTGNPPSCSNNQHVVCCNSVLPILGDILCAVGILGSGCGGGTYCCSANGAPAGLISLNALNCLKIG